MTTLAERKSGRFSSVCGYVKKEQLEEIKNLIGDRGWQEKVLSRALSIILEFLKTAGREELFHLAFDDAESSDFEITLIYKPKEKLAEKTEELPL